MPTVDRAICTVRSLDDARIAEYRNLKDRDLARGGELFIAEGERVVRRLLAADRFAVRSVLLAERKAGRIAPLAPASVPVYAAPADLVSRIVGFRFHSGVIACARRPESTSLDQALAALPGSGPATIVVLPRITNTVNLGALLRVCGAFGADAVVLGPRCCDPFYRQAVRVSMGAVFRLPLVRSADLAGDLDRLAGHWGFTLAAAVLGRDAEPLASAARPSRLALLFGNEDEGVDPEGLTRCDRRITIPMMMGTDSLNVAVAAAVFLYHFTRDGAGWSETADPPIA